MTSARYRRQRKPNDFLLTLGTAASLFPRTGEEPQDYLLAVFERLYTKKELARRFPDRSSMAEAGRAALPEAFGLADLDHRADRDLLAAVASAPSHFSAVATALRDLVRGYTEVQVKARAKGLRARRDLQLRQARRYRTDSERLREEAAERTHREILRDRYAANRDELDQIILDLDAIDVLGEAHAALKREALQRRHGAVALALDLPPRLFLPVKLKSLDPVLVDFPLRHMEWLTPLEYAGLVRRWTTDHDRAKLLLPLAREVFQPKFFDSLEALVSEPCFGFRRKQLDVYKELRAVTLERRPQAAALIAITQTEGLLWAYAEHLQRSGRPVFKVFRRRGRPRYSLYRWDRRAHDYVERDRNHRPKHHTNRKNEPVYSDSGRQLVMGSFIQEAISPEMYTYLLDEFFDERNGLAHGRMVVNRVLLLQALLCLRSTAESLVEHSRSR